MAVPTITEVTPAEGLTSGNNIVVISGTNFKLPPSPTPTGFVGGDYPRSVAVSFDGQTSTWAHAITEEVIYCRVPEWKGDWDQSFPVSIDVRVANTDSDGVEIDGENATLADGYTIERPGFASASMLQRVLSEFINIFKRHLMANVTMMIGAEYDDDTTDLERLRADAPCVYLIGPAMTPNRLASLTFLNTEEDPLSSDAYRRFAEPIVVDMTFEVQIWAKSARHIMAMSQAFLTMFRDVTNISIKRDPSDEDSDDMTYDIKIPFVGYPEILQRPGFDNLYEMKSSCEIKGVHLDLESGTIIERGWRITDNDGEVGIQIVQYEE